MLLSDILKNAEFCNDYQIVEERAFDTLALCSTRITERVCSFIDDLRYVDSVSDNVTMLITTPDIGKELTTCQYGLVVTKQPRIFFFLLHNYLAGNQKYARKCDNTIIADTAEVSSLAYVAKQNVRIGENVIIEPFVTIYPNVSIGDNTIIRSGARIGGEGFEYKRVQDGILPVKHLGGVEIGCNVEIQNNTCVDKAVYPWDNTVIEDYVKIDNLVYVAHGVKIKKNTMVVANVGIGGRTEIGENSWVGLGAKLRNGVSVGDNARVNMGAVVTKSVDDSQAVSGNFAIEHRMFIEHMKNLTMNTAENK